MCTTHKAVQNVKAHANHSLCGRRNAFCFHDISWREHECLTYTMTCGCEPTDKSVWSYLPLVPHQFKISFFSNLKNSRFNYHVIFAWRGQNHTLEMILGHANTATTPIALHQCQARGTIFYQKSKPPPPLPIPHEDLFLITNCCMHRMNCSSVSQEPLDFFEF